MRINMKRASLLFVIISFVLIILFFTFDIETSFDPPFLLSILNTLFLGLIPFIVAYFAAKTYLETNMISAMLMCCGMLAFGFGSTVAGWLRDIPNGANYTVTIHNTCALVGAVFHLSAAMRTETEKNQTSKRFKRTRLILSISGVCVFTALLPVAISFNWIPPFFDQNGFSMLRQIVLWSSTAFCLSASMLFVKMYQRRESDYFYWYSLSMGLIAVGLFGVCVQPSVGSPIGWIGRIDQYVGCICALLTITTASKIARSENAALSSVIADYLADVYVIYQRVVETSTDAIISIDQNSNILYLNPAAEKMFGIPHSHAARTSFHNFICDRDKALLIDDFQTFMTTGKSTLASKTVELSAQDSSGRMFQIGVSTAMHLLPAGCVATYIIRDITDVKKTEEALRVSENMLRTILDNSRDGINMLDLASGKYVFMSPAQVELTGFTKDEMNGITAEEAYERVHPEDREISIQQQKRIASGIDIIEATEYRWRVKSGEYRWFSDKRKLVQNEQGQPVALVGISRDMTDGKNVELKLKKHADELDQKNKLLDLSSEAIFAWDLYGSITYWNLGAQSLYGYSKEEAIGENSHHLLKTNFPFSNDSIEAILKRDGYWKGELIHTKKDGTMINVETSQQVIVLGDDQKIVIETNRDITEKKKLEEDLRRNESLLNTIVQSTTDLLFINDCEGRVVFVNDAYKVFFGINPEEVIGRNAFELYHDEEAARMIEENDTKVKQTGETIVTEEIVHNPDGILSTFLVTKSPWRDGDGNIMGVVGVSHNITERKKMEEELQQLFSQIADEKERLQSIVESMDDEVWISDMAGNVTQLNYAAQFAHGLKADGTPVIEIVKSLEIMEPDGTPRLKENTPVLRALNGETVSGEEIVRHLNTGELRHRRYSSAPIKDRLGNITGTVTIAKDITEAKRAAQHTIEVIRESEARALALVKELEEADKSKDQFISILSHELRNPLAAISAGIEILNLSKENSQIVKAKEIMKRQTNQLCKLVDDLLELTRITQNKIQLKIEKINLNQIVKRAVEDIRLEYQKKGVKLGTRIQATAIFLNADPVRITQIIGNILMNALKFTQANGEVWLTLKTEGNYAVIRVKDNGIGISEEIMPDIFKPFTQAENTLARSNGGLGLGLSIVKGIVDLHGGDVSVSSVGLGKGSTFSIRLPIIAGDLSIEEDRVV